MAEQFKVAPQNSSIQFGQSKLLQCEPPESHPEAKVTWFKGTEQIDTDKNSHYRLVLFFNCKNCIFSFKFCPVFPSNSANLWRIKQFFNIHQKDGQMENFENL